MQRSGHHRKQGIGAAYNPGQYSASPQDSTYISRSDNIHKSPPSRAKARGVAGSFFSCFTPCGANPAKAADDEYSTTLSHSYSSYSASRTSTMSSTAHYQPRYSGSYSRDDSREEATEFSIAEICHATGNFSTENIIGQGGFGTVYKGKLKDGSLIAVKRAKKNTSKVSSEFKREISSLSKVEHLNLVRFLGWVEHVDEQIIVLEYVTNGTLREHLHGSRGDVLELTQRLDIAVDVAHAITYLHVYTERPIIHRDIKASNILLTENLRAKVTDFGSAHIASEHQDESHISTQVRGSAGYVDPEYIRTFQLTDKSDVYSFGILLVELVTGRHPIEGKRNPKERLTAKWALQKLKEGEIVLAMDPRLRRSPAAITAVENVMVLAAECLSPSRRTRPAMKKCAEALWRIRKEFREMQLCPLTPSHWKEQTEGKPRMKTE